MTHRYSLFGLSLHSHLPIPELDRDARNTADPISVGSEPASTFEHLLSVAGNGMAVTHRQGRFAAWMPGIGGISVVKGRIGVCLGDDAHWDSMRPYLLGMGLAVAMYQLRMLPYHVSAVSLAGSAIAFTGDSGAGKSTLGYEWQRQFGAELVSDDLARIDVNCVPPLIYPGLSRVKLWGDALQAFSLTSDGLSRELHGRDKYYLPGDPGAKQALPLRALVLLQTASARSDVSIQRLSGSQRLIAARATLYRPEFAALLCAESVLTSDLLALCSGIPIYRFTRPRQLELLSAGACQLRERLTADGVFQASGSKSPMPLQDLRK